MMMSTQSMAILLWWHVEYILYIYVCEEWKAIVSIEHMSTYLCSSKRQRKEV